MPGFLKRYPDADHAREALRRTCALRQHAIPTPAAVMGPDPATLDFDRIEGDTGHALIGGDILPLLAVVAGLHGAAVTKLPVYDPLLRIRPRLALTDDPLLRSIADGVVPTGKTVLHGDLHVGQFIRAVTGQVWIVDLDDLALGPPEADFANFVAHLATTDPSLSIADWARIVLEHWRALGGTMDPSVFTRCLHLALLRRHLKLREVGRPDHFEGISAYLRDSSSFSMR